MLAAGGINAALATTDALDSPSQHAADTLREGYWLNDPRAVEILTTEAPRAIEELDRWGAGFARDERGEFVQRFFGAHRFRRTCFVGDSRAARSSARSCAMRASFGSTFTTTST